MATVLAILPEGFEEIEAITPIDIWRRAGMTVTVTSLATKTHVTGRSGITVIADRALATIPPGHVFDVLFLPGGPGVKHLRASPEVREIVGRHAVGERWITAICAAPLVLHDAGLLAGRRYTAHPSAAVELPEIQSDQKVVRDGHIITSCGAGTALDFALAVTSAVLGTDVRESLALSICAEAAS